MQGEPTVLSALNRLLANEIIAISQYFLHSRMLRSQGFGKIAEKLHADSVNEMRHADQLIERILFLEGVPDMECNGLKVGAEMREMLQFDLDLERRGHADLRECISRCESTSDFVSRDLSQRILDAEEAHIDWLETQLALMDQIGMENYQQAQVG